jgi:8-oxo-dGTP pyrophosphatase MutT (NUDIX family)
MILEDKMERQMTATVFIVDEEKVLLLYHKKLKKWLPPGGHMEPNETPPEAAKREAMEEVGMDLEFITQENVWVDKWNAKSFERPFLCMIEEIPAHKDVPKHQHIDFIYVAKPVGDISIIHNIDESDAIAWFTQDEVSRLSDDVEIFVETKEIIRSVFAFCSLLTKVELKEPRSP